MLDSHSTNSGMPTPGYPAVDSPSSLLSASVTQSKLTQLYWRDNMIIPAQIGLSNETYHKISAYLPEQFDEQEVLEPDTPQLRISGSLKYLDDVRFYFDSNPENNSNPLKFTVNISAETFSWEGLPSDVFLYLGHLAFVPSYDGGDGSKVPAQSGDFPFAKDQFGHFWCILTFSKMSNWT